MAVSRPQPLLSLEVSCCNPFQNSLVCNILTSSESSDNLLDLSQALRIQKRLLGHNSCVEAAARLKSIRNKFLIASFTKVSMSEVVIALMRVKY